MLNLKYIYSVITRNGSIVQEFYQTHKYYKELIKSTLLFLKNNKKQITVLHTKLLFFLTARSLSQKAIKQSLLMRFTSFPAETTTLSYTAISLLFSSNIDLTTSLL